MGAWGSGPFDNDDAADWAADLDDADADDRRNFIEATLKSVTIAGQNADLTECSAAVAAAAVVAASLPGGPSVGTDYGPEAGTLSGLGQLAELTTLAISTLEIVSSSNSAWYTLWGESADRELMLEQFEQMRKALASTRSDSMPHGIN